MGGVRVDVNEELKLLCKFKNKIGGRVGGGQGGRERRIEVFVKIPPPKKKKNRWGVGTVGSRGGSGCM